MLLKAVIVCAGIALAETVQGILRIRLLNRRVGDHRARQIGVVTGSVLKQLIARFTVSWIAPATPGQAFAVGGIWVVLMLAFEISIGRWVFHASWERIASDFDLRRGRWLAFGMLILLFAPLLGAKLSGLW